jgi:methyl-accepting chemotaxis protein
MGRTPNRRQLGSILQNRRVQLIHALLIVTYLSVYTLLLSIAALAPTIVALQGDAESATLTNAAELFLFEDRVWPLALLLIVACGVHSIFMSHRVFGPLVRVRHEAALIGSGDLTRRIRFRKNDHMLELRDSLNAMVEELDRNMGEVHLMRARLKHRIEELEGDMLTGGGAERRTKLEALIDDFARLEQALAIYRTSEGWERLKSQSSPVEATPATSETLAADGGASGSAAPGSQSGSQSSSQPGTGTSPHATTASEGGDEWDGSASDQAASA